MKVCSWCDDVIERPTQAALVQAVSHGICRACLAAELAKLRPTLAPAPRFATPVQG